MKLDLLLRNAHALTLDDAHPQAHTIGIWNGRILGLDDDVADLPAQQTIDLEGATVLPGFNEACQAFYWVGAPSLRVPTHRSHSPSPHRNATASSSASSARLPSRSASPRSTSPRHTRGATRACG